jgi:hypothetical protein
MAAGEGLRPWQLEAPRGLTWHPEGYDVAPRGPPAVSATREVWGYDQTVEPRVSKRRKLPLTLYTPGPIPLTIIDGHLSPSLITCANRVYSWGKSEETAATKYNFYCLYWRYSTAVAVACRRVAQKISLMLYRQGTSLFIYFSIQSHMR